MQIDTNGFELDDVVVDRITGLHGTIVAISQWTTGCARAAIQPRVDKDGKVPEQQSCDVLTLEMVTAGPRHKTVTPLALTGGPRPEPQRGR